LARTLVPLARPTPPPQTSPLFPYTTLFRSNVYAINRATGTLIWQARVDAGISSPAVSGGMVFVGGGAFGGNGLVVALDVTTGTRDRKSTRLNSSHQIISYAVVCLKTKTRDT